MWWMPRCSGATSLIRKEYLLSKETAIIMAVLPLLALFVGAGGMVIMMGLYVGVWFLPFFYPLMLVLKGLYINVVHSLYPSYKVVEVFQLPRGSFIPEVTYLRGFEVPGVWMPFLVHIPYWLAISYGLSALIHRYREGIRRFLAGMVEEMRRLHGYQT